MIMTCTSAEELERCVQGFLLEKEAVHNLPLGIMNRLKNEEQVVNQQEEPFFGYIHEHGQIRAVIMRTPPHMWIVATNEPLPPHNVEEMVCFWRDHHYDVPGLIGTPDTIYALANAWNRVTGHAYSIQMNQKVYQLDEVILPSKRDGQLVKAAEEDQLIAKRWIYLFGQEAGIDTSEEDAEKSSVRHIKNGALHLWIVDGEPVSMAIQARSTLNGVTINGVYTPDAHKRKGYATSAVAALSQQLLDRGFQFCSLYTDASNATSNSIYQKIGYYEVGDSLVIQFP
ncbi:GNAT family N-acetyltransferase [Pontibacillus litoralis]|uniref:N-acetyltransferase domain-containing protein n=1 Tax=Pontibacillus litoralis JSM 072002 TaxID=1385512 RepID=A0A0A5G810_9BACI|nr:GNAT family N-acetyltransferase [Pontibacillus litoralis]KGX87245.1 hypothetical protein N784_16285 [Pontibacillus litoralis JSM 072002]